MCDEVLKNLDHISLTGLLNTYLILDFFVIPQQKGFHSELSFEGIEYRGAQLTITCSKSTIETLEKGVKFVQS